MTQPATQTVTYSGRIIPLCGIHNQRVGDASSLLEGYFPVPWELAQGSVALATGALADP